MRFWGHSFSGAKKKGKKSKKEKSKPASKGGFAALADEDEEEEEAVEEQSEDESPKAGKSQVCPANVPTPEEFLLSYCLGFLLPLHFAASYSISACVCLFSRRLPLVGIQGKRDGLQASDLQ